MPTQNVGLTNVTTGRGNGIIKVYILFMYACVLVCSGHTSLWDRGGRVFAFFSLTISGLRTKREMKAEWKRADPDRKLQTQSLLLPRSVVSDVTVVQKVKSVFARVSGQIQDTLSNRRASFALHSTIQHCLFPIKDSKSASGLSVAVRAQQMRGKNTIP